MPYNVWTLKCSTISPHVTKLVRIVIRLNLRLWTENHCLHRGAGRSVSAEIGQATRSMNESTTPSNGSQVARKGNRGTIIATNINIHYTSCLLYARHHDKYFLKWTLQFYSSFSHVYYVILSKGGLHMKVISGSILMRRSRLAKYNIRLHSLCYTALAWRYFSVHLSVCLNAGATSWHSLVSCSSFLASNWSVYFV